ncbi:hypothetical protein EDC01DRAFT_667922 [Geopyxis carbonaria]|nr:hypothetical protein EDC01DRAFT_667922 [Geopyxis carbonaria]
MPTIYKLFTDAFEKSLVLHREIDAEEYSKELATYWNVGNQDIKPQAIFRPKTSADAAKAVKLCADNNIPFGIRSGGAMPNIGFNNSAGVLIVTRHLNAEITFPREGVCSVGPGVRWETVYQKLLENGNTAVGTRSTVMALGGSILGGGLSHLSSQHGWAADNVVNFEVALAGGEVVDANDDVNQDLFWALKGGSNNFGLVTRFDIKIIPQPDGIWGGLLTVNPANITELLEALYDWQLNEELNDPLAAVECIAFRGTAYGGMNSSIPVVLLYYGGPTPYPAALKRFTDLPSIANTLRSTTHLDLIRELSEGVTKDKRHIFYTGTFKASKELNVASPDIFFDTLNAANIPEISLCAFTLQAIPPKMLAVAEGKNPMGLPSSEAPYIFWNMAIEYMDGGYDQAATDAARTAKYKIENMAKNLGKHVDFLFLNDAGPDQNPFKTWGEENYQKLLKVRETVDSEKVFTRLCQGFKLD